MSARRSPPWAAISPADRSPTRRRSTKPSFPRNADDPEGVARSVDFFAQAYSWNGQKVIAFRGTDSNAGNSGLGYDGDAVNGYGLALGSYAGAQANFAWDNSTCGVRPARTVSSSRGRLAVLRVRLVGSDSRLRTGLDGGREAFKTRRQGGLKSPDDFLRFGRLWPFSEVLNN